MLLRGMFLLAVAVCTHLSAFTSLHNALDAQIEEDLSGIAPHSFTNAELLSKFYELSNYGRQFLYCRIRSNKIEWVKSSPQNDENRNKMIFGYFSEFMKKYSLPDMDFILSTEDGLLENSDVPIFAFAANKKTKKNVCLIPDCGAMGHTLNFGKILNYSERHPWEQKLNKVFFRGGATGGCKPDKPYFGNARVRATVYSQQNPDILEAGLIEVWDAPIRDFLSQLNISPVPFLSMEDHFIYKYLLDIDGHTTTFERGRWILMSNSVLLKVTSDLTQWYYKILVPYENYVPVRQDLSDLKDIFDWLIAHDEQARKIAMNGQYLGLDAFSKENIDWYVYKLLLGYSEKIAFDPNIELNFHNRRKRRAR